MNMLYLRNINCKDTKIRQDLYHFNNQLIFINLQQQNVLKKPHSVV